MSKEKSLIVSKENILKRMIKFIKNIFVRNNKIEEINEKHIIQEEKQKDKFISNLQESTKAEETIEKVMQDKSLLYNMSLEELKELNNSIKIRQDNLNQRVAELKMQIAKLS